MSNDQAAAGELIGTPEEDLAAGWMKVQEAHL